MLQGDEPHISPGNQRSPLKHTFDHRPYTLMPLSASIPWFDRLSSRHAMTMPAYYHCTYSECYPDVSGST